MPYITRTCMIFLLLAAQQQKVFSQSTMYADSVKVDSINKVLSHVPKTNEIFKTYLGKLDTLSNDEFIIKEVIANWLISNCEKTGNVEIKIQAQQLLGRTFYNTGNYTLANEYLNKVLATGKEDDYFETKSKALEAQAQVFSQTEQFDKQKEYILRNLVFAQKNNYKAGIATAKENYTSVLERNDNETGKDTFNLIIKTLNESLLLWLELKDTAKIIHTYTYLGQTYGDYRHFDTGINIVLKAKEYFTNRNRETIIFYYFILGKTYFNKARANNKNSGDFKNAINYFEACIPLAKEFNNKKQEAWCYDWLSASYKFLGNYTQAYNYLEKHSYLYGSIVSESNFKQLAAVEHKYEKEKQDKEIIQLNADNKQKSLFNKILFGAAAALVFIGFLGYRNFKSKQKIQKQQITELEKEKQLMAVDAMLKGQEEERGRLAKDLHDGLGGMLSGVKLSFSNMKENLILDADTAVRFERSISQLDNTIAELRKVAHNLMPEALVKFGLKSAVEDFCETLQSSSGCKIMYQQLGAERDLENIANVNIYRIIQELVNNAVKHAHAKQIIVQLTKLPAKVLLSVEDDGEGFDVNNPDALPGIGLTNINNRVQYLNGKIDVSSKKDEGTAFNIEVTA